MADDPRASRKRYVGLDHRAVGGHGQLARGRHRRVAGAGRAVDKRRHHRHKGDEKYPEIDDDETDELAPDVFDSRIERLVLFVVVLG